MIGKYDYSKFVYVNLNTKGIVICPIHGEFLITPVNHIKSKSGCPKCRNRKYAGYWNLDTCKKDALKYKYKSEWRENSPTAYNAAHRKNWIDECCKHMIQKKRFNGYWNLDTCKAEALKYDSKKEWRKKSNSSYSMACINGWVDECCKHMTLNRKNTNYWNLDTCKTEALKHNTRKEWGKKSGSSYNIALRKGWIDECCKHMKVLFKKWDLNTCKIEALKYNSKKEWREKSGSSYNAAYRNGWFDQCFKNMNRVNLIKRNK